MSEPTGMKSEYRDDCLIIRIHGRTILEKMPETMQAIAATMRARPVRATLVDLREVPGPFGFLDRFQLGEMVARHLPRVPLASLLREEQADPKRIGQLAARNRGAILEVFTDPAAAEAWLKKVRATGNESSEKS